MVPFKPLSECRRFITWEFSPSIYPEDSLYEPFDLRVSQEIIDERGEKGSKPTIKIGMSEKPIPKRPSFFIQVFRFGDEVEFRDVYSRGANHITEVASNAEVNPIVNRRVTRLSESLSPRTCLFGSWKFWSHSRDRADRHAGSTADTNIESFSHLFHHIDLPVVFDYEIKSQLNAPSPPLQGEDGV
jgi:hypothetical protein